MSFQLCTYNESIQGRQWKEIQLEGKNLLFFDAGEVAECELEVSHL